MNASPITTVVENATQSLAQKPVEAQVRARVWAPVRILIPLRICAEIHRLASHCLYENFTEVYEKVMKTSKEGKREKTMIETRRGREREAEEEAEVRKQGGIGGGRS
jgi:hypothetical protein